MFTRLGFAFFRLISIEDRGPGEPRYAVLRMREARTTMAAFAAAA
jgi:hypothetical protein